MTAPSRTVLVRVPATSANLGAGYDTFGLALSLYDEVEVEATPSSDPGVTVAVSGVGAGIVPEDGSNLVAKTIARVYSRHGRRLPALHLRCTNAIPHGSGLGSSAAAIVAGVQAARGLLAGDVDLSREDVYAIATEFEGHPDNAAPAVFGGFTISWMSDGAAQVANGAIDRRIRVVAFTPDFSSPTAVARTLVPEAYPKPDALHNVARAALFVHAISAEPALLLPATQDRLHQPYRAAIMRPSSELVARLRGEGIAAAISGAGPTVLALCTGEEQAERAVAASPVASATRWTTRRLAIDTKGATVDIR